MSDHALVWQDIRTDRIIAVLNRDGRGDVIRAKTGLPAATYFSTGELQWLLDNVDGLLMDLDTLDWDDELLTFFGIPRSLLPPIRPSSDPGAYGVTGPAGPFGGEVPLTAVLGDQQAAMVGQTCVAPGEAKNCAGGRTPWDTWLSCEEVTRGRVFETYPLGGTAVPRFAMGRFKHEAAAADPVRRVIYLTEDETDGRFYRFVPITWGDQSAGTLQVFRAGGGTSGSFTWATVPDPDGSPTATRRQVSGSKAFNGGEGCHYADDTVWFTTKGDNRVWQVDLAAGTYQLAYDDSLVSPGSAPPTGVDNITGSASGDLYVAEDGGNMEICMITPDSRVSPFLRIQGQGGSEITGPAFTPAGDRLYFSSQRGTSGQSSGGITYCVTGPFRR